MRKAVLILAVMLMANTCGGTDIPPFETQRTPVDHLIDLVPIDTNLDVPRRNADDFTSWLGDGDPEQSQMMNAPLCSIVDEEECVLSTFSYLLDAAAVPFQELDKPILGTEDRFLQLRNCYSALQSE